MNRPFNRQYLMVGAALLGAAGIGFAAAQFTGDKPAPTTAPASAEAEHASETPEGTLVMSAEKIAGAGIELQPVANNGLSGEILSQAEIHAAPDGEAVLTARAAGAIARITKRLGDPVRAGEVIALVESRDAASIAADRSVAGAKATLARKTLARERRLYDLKVSPRQDLETAQAELAAAEAEARRASVAVGAAKVTGDGRYVMVTSPISGRIISGSPALGAYVQPETELFRIADPSRLQVEAAVTAADASRIQPGDPAVIELGNGQSLSATVRSVTPGLDETTRAATVVLNLASGGLQPGQLARARITPRIGDGAAGIVVPEMAIQTVEGRDVVFVRTSNGFQAKPVTVGSRSAGRAAIIEGLVAGQMIAVKGAFLLKAELGKSEAEHHD